jgi:proteasome lid subunit RPN8/RPN11
MVTMKKYSGGVGTSKGQPFRVVVAADVLLLADLHAHLSSDGTYACGESWVLDVSHSACMLHTHTEVIGFLGGKWDREASTLHITHVFPGKSVHVCGNQRCVVVASARQCGFCAAQGEDVSAHVQCEMDPVQEVKIRGVIEASGLAVVGWYHSHPTFEPVPSQCDIDNQCNYQAFFRDHGAAVDPFVGLIVSPFDLRLPSLQSAVAWYYVSSPQTQPCPMVVDVDVVFDLPSGPPPAVGTTEDGIVPSDAVSPDVVPSKRLDALVSFSVFSDL